MRKLSLLACCCVPVTIFSPLRLHADGDNDIQTPFGELLDTKGIKKDKDGYPFDSCIWTDQEPIWQSASDAVVYRNGDNLVHFAVNKPLVKKPESEWTLDRTIFWNAELPTLARYPPAEGFRVLNEHDHVRCYQLMPLIRTRIEQNGLLSDWQKVKTFSCIDVDQVSQPYDRQNLDKAREFLKPGERMSHECRKSNNALNKELYAKCRAKGEIDLEFFHSVAKSWFPPAYIPHIGALRLPNLVKEHGSSIVLMLPDIFEMFDTSIGLEICLVRFTEERGNKVFVFFFYQCQNELGMMLIALSGS